MARVEDCGVKLRTMMWFLLAGNALCIPVNLRTAATAVHPWLFTAAFICIGINIVAVGCLLACLLDMRRKRA